MTPRERVNMTMSHRQADKMAVDFGGTCCSTMHVSCVEALRNYYKLEYHPVTVWEVYTMIGKVENDLMDKLGGLVFPALPLGTAFGFPRVPLKQWTTLQGQDILVPEKFMTKPDGKGGYYVYPQGDLNSPASGHMPSGSYYFDAIIRQQPFEEDDLDPNDQIEEYGLLTEKDISFIRDQVDAAYATGKYVVLQMPGMGLGDIAEVPGVGLKHPKGIRSIEEWYMSPLLRPDYVFEVFKKQTDILIQNLQKVSDACKDKIDALFGCGTDFAHQKGQFISNEIFREIYLPHYKRANDWIHNNTKWKVIKHSCGAVNPLIPLFIEAGFDAINPVQCSADDMEPRHLKEEYGKDVTFWGGGIDTQEVLPYGTPEDVRKQTLERCKIFARDGGFVFGAIHNIQANVPIHNIIAMIDAIREFNGDY
jgi:hypothetical protein